jgi:iron complex outermembrane receptor protein
MLAARAFDPFAPIGEQSATTKQLIADSLFHGSIRDASTTLKAVDARGSHDLFTLAGGTAQLAVGADYRKYAYQQTPSAAAQGGVLYNFDAPATYDLSRDTYGAFMEALAPVTKQLELTGALRYDSVSAIDDGVAQAKVGKDSSKFTYKLSARFQPTQQLLFRGSYGTGFKAPAMLDIAQPLVNSGWTASNWDCPIAHAQYCRPGRTQYNVLSGGNANLKPESSKQFTLGMRFEPSASYSMGIDLWDVKISDAVKGVTEQQAFGDPVKFRDLFTTYTETSTGDTYWAFKRLSVNIGRTHNRGIDWDFTSRQRFAFGTFTGTISGTHMLRADYTVPGTDDQWTSSMNYFGINNAVTFRNLMKIVGTLETGKLSNTFTVSYRNDYTDAAATVRNLSTGTNESIRLHVPSYTTLDWQGRYVVNDALVIRGGIKNLLDREPPMSLRNSSGHQVGYDPRYADQMGRQAYVTANYKF